MNENSIINLLSNEKSVINRYNMDDVKELLDKLFRKPYYKEYNISVENEVLVLEVTDDNFNTISKIDVFPNVKNNRSLGYFDTKVNLCVLPISNDRFIIKKGCNKNIPIRPLFAKF